MIIRKKADLQTSLWSGGTTTELFIHPEQATYAARDFDVRISTATVEVEESAFTALPGYERTLMVLQGELKMIHETGEGQREVLLKAFEQAQFSGSWKTTGYGRVTDFNVMCSNDFRAETDCHRTAKGDWLIAETTFFTLLYLLEGMLECEDGSTIFAGDVVVLHKGEMAEFQAVETALFVLVELFPEPQ